MGRLFEPTTFFVKAFTSILRVQSPFPWGSHLLTNLAYLLFCKRVVDTAQGSSPLPFSSGARPERLLHTHAYYREVIRHSTVQPFLIQAPIIYRQENFWSPVHAPNAHLLPHPSYLPDRAEWASIAQPGLAYVYITAALRPLNQPLSFSTSLLHQAQGNQAPGILRAQRTRSYVAQKQTSKVLSSKSVVSLLFAPA